jgi:hypothetical protein
MEGTCLSVGFANPSHRAARSALKSPWPKPAPPARHGQGSATARTPRTSYLPKTPGTSVKRKNWA